MALAAPATAATATSNCGGDQITVDVQRPDGTSLRFAADRGDIENFSARRRAAVQARAAVARAIGSTSLNTETGLVFDRVRDRIPGFADWAYGWASNYVFSYELLYTAGSGAVRSLLQGEPVLPAVEQSVDRAIGAQFRKQVFEPVAVDRALAEARISAGEDMRAVWTRFLRDEAAAWTDFAAAACPVAAGTRQSGMIIDLRPDVGVPAVLNPRAPAELPAVDDLSLRALRPLGARVVILTLRVFELGSLAMLPALLGLSGSLPWIAGVFLTTSLVWTIDYAINAIDAGLHRSSFERNLRIRVDSLAESTHRSLDRSIPDDLELFTRRYRESFGKSL